MELVDDWSVTLYIAGDYAIACRVAGDFCRRVGWCVSVTPTRYVYSGGQEYGVICESIAYARFGEQAAQAKDKMRLLAAEMVIALNQRSYTLTDGTKSEWHTVAMPFEVSQ